ncbi:hypothetical protein [Microbulbifer sp. YPW16]|uniref:hypothetical protein n=1 Tax=Microbulbifer sp. YPW16 TaxID=2904242 RepID=UPI001E35AD98|nr:hypothetical protein [Microbulbifer sp. YPW16]UHQ53737.1 hypothetical protein LVE68_09440 [Microbulbifer sp. YPW16]
MSIGSSGRIVIEIEPDLKQKLHSALREDGVNLKSWFLENVDHFLSGRAGQDSAETRMRENLKGTNREI